MKHTPTTNDVSKAWVQYRQHTHGTQTSIQDAENEFYEFIAAAEQRGAARAEQAIYELTEAIRFTVEYVGNDTLPPINGWSWFDALRKYRPELAEHFEQNPQLMPDNHVTRESIAEQIADRLEGDDDTQA